MKDFEINSAHSAESFSQAVSTDIDGSIKYITAHIFYEDLAKIQQNQLNFD